MQPSQITGLSHLLWNQDLKCFEIEESTDRKIVSFLFTSVMQSCSFYKPERVHAFPWPMAQFKAFYLENLEKEFASHIHKCPTEEYRETLQEFYTLLCTHIRSFQTDDEMSKQQALQLLQMRTMRCFLDLFTTPPLNFQKIGFEALPEKYADAIYNGQCYHYAFYLAKEYEALMKMRIFESPCNGAFLLYPKFFLKRMGYSETAHPTTGDLVLFLGDSAQHNNLRFKHLAIMTAQGTIRNRWGKFTEAFEQSIYQVPEAYGRKVIIFHKSVQITPDFDQITRLTTQFSSMILEFNQQSIPTPLSNLGVLHFFHAWLHFSCSKKINGSEKWKWRRIEQSLLAEFPNHDALTRSALILNIYGWVQDFLSEHSF